MIRDADWTKNLGQTILCISLY